MFVQQLFMTRQKTILKCPFAKILPFVIKDKNGNHRNYRYVSWSIISKLLCHSGDGAILLLVAKIGVNQVSILFITG